MDTSILFSLALSIVSVSVGIILTLRRFILRKRGCRVNIQRVEISMIWESVRKQGLYRYTVEYIDRGKVFKKESLEFNFFLSSYPQLTQKSFSGILCTNGQVSLDKIYSVEKISFILILAGLLKFISILGVHIKGLN